MTHPTPLSMQATRPSRPPRPQARSGRWLLLALILLVAAPVMLMIVLQLAPKTIEVEINGEARQVRTHAETVEGALDDMGVIIDAEDEVWPPLSATLSSRTTISVQKAHAIALRADGELRQVRSLALHPLDVLAEQRIHLGLYDVLYVDEQPYSRESLEQAEWTQPPDNLRVVRSQLVRVLDGERVLLLHTTQADVGRALDEAGMTLYLADRVEPPLSTPVRDGLAITIQRSVPLHVLADGHQIETRAVGPTVGDALAMIGVAPVGLDFTNPPPDTPIQPDMQIEVVRVVERVLTETDTIPFTTIYQLDLGLRQNEERVVQQGSVGRLERQIQVRYENGKEVSRVIQKENITQAPTPRLIMYGKPSSTREMLP